MTKKKVKEVGENESSNSGPSVMYYGRASNSSRASRRTALLWRYGRAVRALKAAVGKPRLA